MKPKFIPLLKTYQKENGLWVLNLEEDKIFFTIKEKSIVYLPPHQFGGNHSHPRIETFIDIGEGLWFYWKEKNKIKKEKMNPNNEIFLIIVPSFLPHAVFNNSDQQAVIFEFASDKQKDVKFEEVI